MATKPSRSGIKNVTPPAGARTRAQAKQADKYVPRFKSDKPQPRSKGGRGNEQVTNDDVARVAEQSLTAEAQEDRWARVNNAVEYLRRYVEHLEQTAKNEDKKLTPMASVRLMDQIGNFIDRLSDMVKSPAEKVYNNVRFVLIPDVFSDNELTTLTLEGIGRCNVLDDISVTIAGASKEEKEQNKLAFYSWLVNNEQEDLLTQTVNAQTLAAFVRAQLKKEDGLKLPTDLIDIKPVTRAQITRK